MKGVYAADNSKETPQRQALFIHEMVHVWQHQRKVMNVKLAAIWEMVEEGFDYEEAYNCKLKVGNDLLDYDSQRWICARRRL